VALNSLKFCNFPKTNKKFKQNPPKVKTQV